MIDRPPFDPERAAFLLIAGVLALYGMIALVAVGACAIYFDQVVRGTGQCHIREALSDFLTAALAAALALSGRRPPPKGPDNV